MSLQVGDEKIEAWLRKNGLSAEQIEEGGRLSEKERLLLGEALFRLGYLSRMTALEAAAVEMGIPFIPALNHQDMEREWAAKVPIAFSKKNELIPLRLEEDKLLVAIAHPENLHALDDLRLLFGREIKAAVSPPEEILNAINQMYGGSAESAGEVIDHLEENFLVVDPGEIPESVDLLDSSDEAPVIRLVNSLVFQAVKQRASDIHIEPFERDFAIRYRIDGILYNILTPPRRLQSSVTSRIKIMAGLDIAEKRLPQDGRISIKVAGKEVDIRVSTIPTAFGERVVLRLLDKQHLLLNLEELGYSEVALKTISRLIQLPHGIILVTGPTGSGKTTTLYSILNKINSPGINIITIEDPIEYQLKGVGQMQVNPKIDLTFANGLRSILRQDPDVILIGEIRDSQTAEIAIHASLTGHLVFSTLHTNDSAGAMTRLIEMGIEPFLVSSSLVAVIAQRLVRRLCPECRTAYTPLPEEVERLGLKKGVSAGVSFYRAVGCAQCGKTGYRGRMGIYEVFLVDDEIRSLILSKADSSVIKSAAVRKGMLTLRDDGARKVVSGWTTTDEVLRVSREEN